MMEKLKEHPNLNVPENSDIGKYDDEKRLKEEVNTYSIPGMRRMDCSMPVRRAISSGVDSAAFSWIEEAISRRPIATTYFRMSRRVGIMAEDWAIRKEARRFSAAAVAFSA